MLLGMYSAGAPHLRSVERRCNIASTKLKFVLAIGSRGLEARSCALVGLAASTEP